MPVRPLYRRLLHRSLAMVAICWGLSASLPQAAEPTPEGINFFESKIRPVLVKHCYRCHSDDGGGARGGLMLETRHGVLTGGDSGPAVVPGAPEESWLLSAIRYEDFQMPPDGPLPPSTVDDFREWISMGAPDPRVTEVTVVQSEVTAGEIEAGKSFWAFRPPAETEPPSPARDRDWPVTAIDRYVLDGIHRNGLAPAPDAEPHVILRRLHFDLVGLPPAADRLDAFTDLWRRDPEAAVRREIDRLLESPRFGERWGRHWLDVARYAESSGKEVDVTFPHAWRYRDYVIDSLNRDKPYDEFVREQIAGDLLPAADDAEWAEHLVATGFLAIGPKTLTEQNPLQFRADLIDEQIDTTTRAILGISVACARCHDHKFDPIPQTDYYALAGIFESTETYFGGVQSRRARRASNLLVLPVDDPNPFDPSIDPETRSQLEDRLAELRRDYVEARREMRRPAEDDDGRAASRRRLASPALLDRQIASIAAQLDAVDRRGQPLTLCMGVQAAETPKNARVLLRGEVQKPAQGVPRGLIQVIGPEAPSIAPDSGGRLELANWLTRRDNPLTARVMVNRIWLHLLGAPLVAETENFGASGSPPTHPELLDHLAVTFMDSGWSIKTMIREIARSRVYRLASVVDEASIRADPKNVHLARGHRRRLEAEAIRDAMLAVSGELNLERPRASEIARYGQTVLGPDGTPPRPLSRSRVGQRAAPLAAMMGGRFRRGFERSRLTPPGEDPVTNRHRSIYLPISRNAVPRSLEVFDFAEPSMLVGLREQSNTANQALYLLNNPDVIRLGDAFARRLVRAAKSPQEIVRRAFVAAYSRPATDEELRRSIEFLLAARADASRDRGDARRGSPRASGVALSQFCQTLLASAEFRYLP